MRKNNRYDLYWRSTGWDLQDILAYRVGHTMESFDAYSVPFNLLRYHIGLLKMRSTRAPSFG